MRTRTQVIVSIMLACAASLFLPLRAQTQDSKVPPRIRGPIDEANRVTLTRNTHPLARPEFDRGAAPASLPLERMLLVLRRSPEQQAALDALLASQQDPSSPDYHRWLTPQQFGQQFGPADEDIQAITSWLSSHGFQVNRVAQGRVVIEFSGTAGQLREAFHTEMHKYAVNGLDHWANSADPEIPAALAPEVAGISTLHNFLKKPLLNFSGETVAAQYTPGPQPQLTFMDGRHGLTPGDFAVIYNVGALPAAGINGTGETVGVVARSNINFDDVARFREVFGQPANNVFIIVNGPDPGDLGGGEEVEAVLDATWAGGAAGSANVNLVISASTATTDGVDLSEVFIIENNAADIMTESFNTCEAGVGAAEAAAKSALAEQAAAEGITYFVSSGDNGAEGCDDFHSETTATGPIAVNLLASSPYTVAVGGTQFNENGNDSKYWSPSTTSAITALSYIPENVWNQSCLSTSCPSGISPNIVAGGGGSSILYPKPPWQTGVAGIPADNARDLPDVSLNASGRHDGYLICLRGSCIPDSQGFIRLFFVGGTSVSSPSFASIMALVDQKAGGRQGQANYVLYRMAAQETLASCNGSSQTGLPAPNCIFNDITVGNNAVPGESGYGTPTASYQSGTGYDLATGLGSVNVFNLVNGWANMRSQATQFTSFTLMPASNIQHGITPVSISATVAPQMGTGTPTGDIALIPQKTGVISGGVPLPAPAAAGFATLVNGTASGSTMTLPGGTYNVIAHYQGDGTFLPSDSLPVQVTVNPEGSTTVVSAFQGSLATPVPVTSLPYGTPFSLGATVTGQTGNGTPAGFVNFLSDGSFLSIDSQSLSAGGQAVEPAGAFFIPPGLHSISAQYIGDQTFNGSTAVAIPISITPAATRISLQSNTQGVIAGQPVMLTATLTATSSGLLPSGSASFFSGTTPLGSAALSGMPGPSGNVSLTASLTTSQLPNGTDSITAQYSGDTNYSGSASAAVAVTVSGTFLITAASPNILVLGPGGSGSTTLMFQSATGFSGAAMLFSSACSNLPPESTCTFSPAIVSFNGTATSVPVMLTVNTSAPSVSEFHARRFFPGLRLPPPARGATLVCIGVLSLLLLRTRRPGRRAALASLAFVAIALSASCGGGGGGGGTVTHVDPGTPAGAYPGVTVTVTINGSTQSVNNLVVQVE
jgi:subtilase family serine protease